MKTKRGIHTLTMLQHIAAQGKANSAQLAALCSVRDHQVASILAYSVSRGIVKMHRVSVADAGTPTMISEYCEADIDRYHALAYQHHKVEKEPVAAVELVPPRTPPVNRPLNLARLIPALPYREGMWDYKAIPSRYAETKKCG